MARTPTPSRLRSVLILSALALLLAGLGLLLHAASLAPAHAAEGAPGGTALADAARLDLAGARQAPRGRATAAPAGAGSALSRQYLPLIARQPTATSPLQRITGRVTYSAVGAPGIRLRLYFWKGAEYEPVAATDTVWDGDYVFEAPSTSGNESYQVCFLNETVDSRYLSYWCSMKLMIGGSSVTGVDFDIGDVGLVAPADRSTVNLPVTFTWKRRWVPGDSYALVIFDPATWKIVGATDLLGDVGSFVGGLPQDAVFGHTYGWAVDVCNGDKGCGSSFHYHRITFAGGPAGSAQRMPRAEPPASWTDRFFRSPQDLPGIRTGCMLPAY